MSDKLVDYVIKRRFFSSSQMLSDVYDNTIDEVLSILVEEIDNIIFIDNKISKSIDLSDQDKDCYEENTKVDYFFDIIRWCSNRIKKRIELRTQMGNVHFIDGICEDNSTWIDKFVKPEWKSPFLKFIETGECSKEFEQYMNNDENCQKAVNIAFNIKSKNLEKFEGVYVSQ